MTNEVTFIDMFWGTTVYGDKFIPFTKSHLLGVLFVFMGIALLMQTRPMLNNPVFRRKTEWFLATILTLQQTILYAWYITSGNFTLAESLPLYSCRLAIIGTVILLLTRHKKLFDIVYYWGIVGGLIALITPDTSGFGPPHIMFMQYFFGHGTLIVSILYMMLAYDYYPTKASLKWAYKITSIYFVGIFFINKLVGGNYSYLNGKPSTPTMLDALPPYPYYIVVLLGAMFALFFLAYLPFSHKRGNQTKEAAARFKF